jgi:hypothetical protein
VLDLPVAAKAVVSRKSESCRSYIPIPTFIPTIPPVVIHNFVPRALPIFLSTLFLLPIKARPLVTIIPVVPAVRLVALVPRTNNLANLVCSLTSSTQPSSTSGRRSCIENIDSRSGFCLASSFVLFERMFAPGRRIRCRP